MKFDQIVILDDINISNESIIKLTDYSKNSVRRFDIDPEDEEEIIKRVGNADCILLSWRTPITKTVISNCKNLKFICLCGTNSNLIDVEACSDNNIIVSNITDYGDEGVVEWIFFELLSLVRGFGKYQWQDHPAELSRKTLGIIGLGAIGKLLAKAALGFGMKVYYNSQIRKSEWDKKGLVFVDKKELLQKSDIISLQTPKNVKILDKDDFDLLRGKILINNTLGMSFKEDDFMEWIKKPNNFVIMDVSQGENFYNKVRNSDRVIFSNIIAGRTKESILRLSQKVLDNIDSYLSDHL